MPPPPLDETLVENQLGHLSDHEYIAEQLNNLASGAVAFEDVANVFTETQTFGKPVGTAFLTDGNLVASGGGDYFRTGTAIAMASGTNGSRGDGIVSDAPQNTDGTASFFINHVASGEFDTKGSHIIFYAVGTHAALAGGGDAYGEHAGFVSFLTHERLGGLTEGYESSVHVTTAGRVMGFVSVIRNDAALTYWCEGYRAISTGSAVAGDAFNVRGAAGWTNFLRFLHTDGAERFRVNAAGKMYIGAGARTLFDDGANLRTDSILSAGVLYTEAGCLAQVFYWAADANRSITWGTGTPEGAVARSVGSLHMRTDGGETDSAYIKSLGTGNTGWRRILTADVPIRTGSPEAASDLPTALALVNWIRDTLYLYDMMAN